MKHYVMQAKRGRGVSTWEVKARDAEHARQLLAEQTGKDTTSFFVKSWQEKGRGGKVLRERNYTTPLEQ